MNVLVRNGLSLISSQATTMLIGLVMLVVVPDYLGDVEFGRFAFSITFVGLFGFVGTFGTGMYLTKTTARDPALLGPYVYSTIVLKLLMAALLSIAALGLAAVLGYDRQMTLLIVAACLTMTITLVNETVVAGLFGLQRMGSPAAWGVVGLALSATCGIMAVLMEADVVVYAFAIVPALLIPLAANLYSLRPELRHAGGVNVSLWRVVLVGGAPFLVMGAIQIVYGSIDMVMLRPLAGDATVGWYALAYRWIALPVLLASTAMLAVFPALSVHSLEPDDRFKSYREPGVDVRRIHRISGRYRHRVGRRRHHPDDLRRAVPRNHPIDADSRRQHPRRRHRHGAGHGDDRQRPAEAVDGHRRRRGDPQPRHQPLRHPVHGRPLRQRGHRRRDGDGADRARDARRRHLLPARWRDGPGDHELHAAVRRGGVDDGVGRPGRRRLPPGRQDRHRCAHLCCGCGDRSRRDPRRVRVVPGTPQRPVGPAARYILVARLADSILNHRGVTCPYPARSHLVACRPSSVPATART